MNTQQQQQQHKEINDANNETRTGWTKQELNKYPVLLLLLLLVFVATAKRAAKAKEKERKIQCKPNENTQIMW